MYIAVTIYKARISIYPVFIIVSVSPLLYKYFHTEINLHSALHHIHKSFASGYGKIKTARERERVSKDVSNRIFVLETIPEKMVYTYI